MIVELDVELTVKDMFKFLLNSTYRKLTGIIWIIFSAVVVFVTIITWGAVPVSNSILMIILASLYTIINPTLLYLKAKKQIKYSDSLANTLHYTIDDKNIKVSQKEAKERTPWNTVWKVVRYGDQVIIYVTSIRAFILPVRCFENGYDDFVTIATNNLNANCKIKKA